MTTNQLEARLGALADKGVVLVDARQIYVDEHVSLSRVQAGAILHPGTRLLGKRTFVSAGAEVGAEGPAVLKNVVLGEKSRFDSGYGEDCVLLREARAGANAHFRDGTLLEEQASTAHAVGLKQTILGSFVTMGSLINFCDALMMGGTSRDDHAEVGSGFIHFNFTPFGKRGDKATASLIGDVPRGVTLREPRIFLGGSAGMVGPRQVGFGAVTVAGQVIRNDVPERRLVGHAGKAIDVPFDGQRLESPLPRARKNVAFIAALVALRAFYRDVRRGRAVARLAELPAVDAAAASPAARVISPEAALVTVYDEALVNLDACLKERTKRLEAFLSERQLALPTLLPAGWQSPACPLASLAEDRVLDHVTWMQRRTEADVTALADWLRGIEDAVMARATFA